MTDEIFEKAIEIRNAIDNIVNLQALLTNSRDNGFGDRYLAAIDVQKTDGCVVKECKVLNHIQVPKNIMEKFESILWDELETLQDEFKSL